VVAPARTRVASLRAEWSTTARLLSTNVWAVRKLIEDGKLKFIPVGQAFLMSPEAIREFIRKDEITRDEKL